MNILATFSLKSKYTHQIVVPSSRKYTVRINKLCNPEITVQSRHGPTLRPEFLLIKPRIPCAQYPFRNMHANLEVWDWPIYISNVHIDLIKKSDNFQIL